MSNLVLPDWPEVFEQVCRRGEKTLEWGLPEQWVHAELFSALKEASAENEWVPFPTELPYLTYYPVALPKKLSSNWEQHGAVKWADLSLRNDVRNTWCWLELKVRHAGCGSRESLAANLALDAFAKDYVGLCGFDALRTASIWADLDKFTKAYWFDEVLGPHSKKLVEAKHYFVSIYLQLNRDLDEKIFSEFSVKKRIESWFNRRMEASNHKRLLPETSVVYRSPIFSNHALVICQSEKWSHDT